MVLAQEQTLRSTEQNREARNGRDSDMQKNEPGPLSYTLHKNKLKTDEILKCKTGNHQNHGGENRQQPL